jgi:hypothetical protein
MGEVALSYLLNIKIRILGQYHLIIIFELISVLY